jgi:TRAP transporter 4TM/12TM fusion protein
MNLLVKYLAIAMSLYHIYIAYFGVPVGVIHRPIHIGFVFAILFLTKPAGRTKEDNTKYVPKWYDFALVSLALSCSIYMLISSERILTRMPYVTSLTTGDMVFGALLVILLLEAVRRTVGKSLVIVAVVFLLYGYFGKYLPYPLWHKGFSVERIIEQVYMTTEGIWGVALHASSTFVFLFVLFGAFLVATGTGSFFTDFARSIAGGSVGGPGKTAAVSSALMGMLSGSSIANVVTTGAFTIPMMKNRGYKPHFAGAVEAVASTGGQIMPPVMGTAAFIMAETLGIPYIEIVKHAVLPAIIYFLSVIVMIHIEALKLGLHGEPRDTLPKLVPLLLSRGYLFLPLVAIVILMAQGYTPLRAALYAIIVLLLLVIVFDPVKRRELGARILEALEEAPKQIIPVSIACAAAGIIVGMILLSGLGFRMTSIIMKISGGILPIALVLTMFLAIILGMGMPTSSAYLIMAALLIPAIIEMGVMPIAAHFFAMYLASMSAITPPVALASYAGAAIAGANPMTTGITGFRLGLSAFIIPFMFVYSPSLLAIGGPITVLTTAITAIIGAVFLAIGIQGWLRARMIIIERLFFFAAALCLINPGLWTDTAGIGLGIISYITHTIRLKRGAPNQDKGVSQ